MYITITLVLTLAGFLFGVVIGRAIERVFGKQDAIGDLRIDESDPEDGPYLFLELNSGPDSIKNRTRVTLNVKSENFISQK